MKIAICDDEKIFINQVADIIDKFYNSLDIISYEFSNGAELLRSFEQIGFDIVFLDIEMPELDGISIAEKLRELSETVYIVFLTGHIEYALDGYKVNALRYLTKPVSAVDISCVIDYVIKKMNNEKYLWVKSSDGEYRIKHSDIIYIESQNQNVIIYTVSGNYQTRKKLNDLENQLRSDGFFRIHRSYIVSLLKVIGINGRNVKVLGGTFIPISRSKETEFRAALTAFVDREAL